MGTPTASAPQTSHGLRNESAPITEPEPPRDVRRGRSQAIDRAVHQSASACTPHRRSAASGGSPSETSETLRGTPVEWCADSLRSAPALRARGTRWGLRTRSRSLLGRGGERRRPRSAGFSASARCSSSSSLGVEARSSSPSSASETPSASSWARIRRSPGTEGLGCAESVMVSGDGRLWWRWSPRTNCLRAMSKTTRGKTDLERAGSARADHTQGGAGP